MRLRLMLVTATTQVIWSFGWAVWAAYSGAYIPFIFFAAGFFMGLWMLGDTLEARARGRS